MAEQENATYHTAKSPEELQQILDLQHANLPTTISETESKAEGFVTVQHDLNTLTAMNAPYGHAIAKNKDNHVIGYALVMQRSFQKNVPVLSDMFGRIDAIPLSSSTPQGPTMGEMRYFLIGQVCIKKGYRGLGIFQGLYDKLKETTAAYFDYCISLVAERNPRSLRAHEKVGFQEMLRCKGDSGEDWVTLVWDWRSTC